MKTTKYSIVLIALLSTANAQEVALEEIEIVSSNKTTQLAKNTTANMTVITESEIAKNGYKSILDAISDSVGINIAQNGGLGQKSSFFMRGLDSSNIVVAIDGMRLNDPSTTNNTAMLEFIPISNVKQIEIIRGGSSSIWGANASAGVINIITKNSKKDGLNGDVGLAYGSHDTKSGDITLLHKSGKLSTKLLVSKLHTDGISAIATTDGTKGEADKFDMQNVIAGIRYDFTNDTKISIALNKTNTNGDYDQTWNGANDTSANYKSKSTNYLGSFSTKWLGIESVLNASRGEFDRKYDDGINVYKATTDEYSLINSYIHSMGKSVLGLEYKDIAGFNQYSTFAPSDSGFTNRAIFLANTIKPVDNLLLEGNVRYDDFDKFDGTTSYKIGGKYDFTKNIKVSANYYKSLNTPSVYQILGSTLRPSMVKGYDVSVGYDNYVTATYFDNKIENEIVYKQYSWPAIYYNYNDNTRYNGLEIKVNSPIWSNIIFGVNYTKLFSFNEQVIIGNGAIGQKTIRPKDSVNASLSYTPTDSLTAVISTQYIGDRIDQNNQTGNYTTWSLHATKEFSNNLSLALHLNNMFNKDYQSIYGYNSDGRNANFKVSYKF
jgi:vitamin B12 transporter